MPVATPEEVMPVMPLRSHKYLNASGANKGS
jgi:hypothetical protein